MISLDAPQALSEADSRRGLESDTEISRNVTNPRGKAAVADLTATADTR